jgi:hypothetical protein
MSIKRMQLTKGAKVACAVAHALSLYGPLQLIRGVSPT